MIAKTDKRPEQPELPFDPPLRTQLSPKLAAQEFHAHRRAFRPPTPSTIERST
jgi:hypothetical protein